MPIVDDNTKMFTGHERDRETGLDYMLARYYGYTCHASFQQTRWSGSKRNPQSLNRYAYVLNNPVKLIDPLGLYGINPNPYNPEGRNPCDGMGPLCSGDKTPPPNNPDGSPKPPNTPLPDGKGPDGKIDRTSGFLLSPAGTDKNGSLSTIPGQSQPGASWDAENGRWTSMMGRERGNDSFRTELKSITTISQSI